MLITVGTVEAHLSRVYLKLGVRSRAELAGRLHQGRDAEPARQQRPDLTGPRRCRSAPFMADSRRVRARARASDHGATMRVERMRVAVLSPHFDDAVLSCWHVLRAHGRRRRERAAPASGRSGGPLWVVGRVARAQTDSAGRARASRARGSTRPWRIAGAQLRSTWIMLEASAPRRKPAGCERASRTGSHSRGGHGCDVALRAGSRSARTIDHVLAREGGAAPAARRPRARAGCLADLPHGLSRGWPTWVAARRAAAEVEVGLGTRPHRDRARGCRAASRACIS